MMKSNHALPPLILRQGGITSIETQLVNQFAMVEDVSILSVPLDRLEEHAELLSSGDTLPVGSVEFVRRAMALAGIEEPANLTYPEPIQRFLLRDVKVQRAGAVLGTHFVKPTKTKTFTGFVFDTMTDPASLSKIAAHPATTPLAVSRQSSGGAARAPGGSCCSWM